MKVNYPFLSVFLPFSWVLLSIVAARGPCDPLVPEYCSLPTPNSFFAVDKSSTRTGLTVSFQSNTLPQDSLGRNVIPNEWNTFDGFSPFPSIITYFNDIDDSTLPPHWDIEQSLSTRSPTILYNLLTGKIIPHFAELDQSFKASNREALMIWPAVRLNDSSHYLVAIKNLKHRNGWNIQPSIAFKALRDDIMTNNTDIEYRRVQYEEYFKLLITSDIITSRNELQLLWEFNTASQECITSRLLHMREDSFKRVGPPGPSYIITNIIDHYSTNVYRHITGIMTVPLYLNTPFPGSHLVIDDNGLPSYQMDASAAFTILIPNSIVNQSINSTMIVQYGHGLFATQAEVEQEYLQEQANRYGYILMSCDQWGLSEFDVPAIVFMLSNNISDFRTVPDRLSQGVINELLLMKLMKGSLYKDPVLTMDNRIVIDNTNVHYYGVSLGGIVGQVYMATSTDVEKGVLGVAGGPFGLLLPRSSDFKVIGNGVRLLYPDPVDYVIMMSLMNMLWSRCGPGGYMNSISGSMLPDTPSHRVVYQYGLGDAQVNILGLYSSARSNGALMFSSNVKQQFYNKENEIITENLYGFDFVADSAIVNDGSVAMGYDCHALPEPMGNIPPNSATDTHELPRRAITAQKQMYMFFKTGRIYNTCNGACNTECTVL